MGLLRTISEWIRPPEDDQLAVEEYVLSRREPDPENRIRTYDEPVGRDEVAREGGLAPGTYILQEVKTNGMAGDVVWEEDIDPAEAAE